MLTNNGSCDPFSQLRYSMYGIAYAKPVFDGNNLEDCVAQILLIAVAQPSDREYQLLIEQLHRLLTTGSPLGECGATLPCTSACSVLSTKDTTLWLNPWRCGVRY